MGMINFDHKSPENTNKPSCGGQTYCRCECHYCGCWEDWDDERKAGWDEATGYDRNKL